MADGPADLEPFSPSAFLNLPPTPDPDGDGGPASADDLVLPLISRMLMDEDLDDDTSSLDRHRHPDHPALLQVQQPFAEILAEATTANGSTEAAADLAALLPPSSDGPEFAGATWPYDPFRLSQQLLLRSGTGGPGVGAGLAGSFLSGGGASTSASFGGQSMVVTMDMLNRAFLKGMEEASKFLPTDSSSLLKPSGSGDHLLPRDAAELKLDRAFASNEAATTTEAVGSGNDRVRKNRHADWDDELEVEAGKNRKLMAPEPEGAGDMVDKMVVDGYDMWMEKMKDLRITRTSSEATTRRRKQSSTTTTEAAVDLRALLIRCAHAVSMDDHRAATELLSRIRQHSSPLGDATQRLAHCFADGLAARLAGTGSQVYRLLLASSKRASAVEFLGAYQLFLTSCCFEMMAYIFSSMTIWKAVAGRKKVHIVDYGVRHYGFQWPSLLAFMATWEGGPPEVRMTGIDLPQPGFRPAARVAETGRRLSSRARDVGVPFKFRHVVAARWETVCVHDLRTDPGEVLIVNGITEFGSLMDDGGGGGGGFDAANGPSCRDAVLGNIRKMRPDVFILCVVNGSYGTTPFFVTRFKEALSHYSAMFDMMAATATSGSDQSQRLVVERDLMGRCALNAIACEGSDRVERHETYKQWQARNRRAGLRQLPLHPDIVAKLKRKVGKYYHKDFVVDVDQQWLLQAWKGRILFAMSAWAADDDAAL
ncbi:hypothetical protein U9M48_011134 [Paspalum notatum var. saurae]|uniref:Scarecrow-like protein 9 n=1 Tax=Paspalum notatum var. saurae TaxID=547442 RepID=A0AAQ3SWK3_PASNO